MRMLPSWIVMVALAEKTLNGFGKTRGKHIAVHIDVLDKVKVQEAADRVLETYGRIDFLINGAGGNNPKRQQILNNRFSIFRPKLFSLFRI